MLSHTVDIGRESWFSDEGPEYEIAISTRVRLARNLGVLPFPHKMSTAQHTELRRAVEEVLHEVEEEYTVLDASSMHAGVRSFFQGRGLLPLSDLDAVSYTRGDERLFVQLAREDHVRISGFAGGFDLRSAMTNARAIDRVLEEKLEYAVSMRLGYLAPAIDRVGTGVSASIMMHLPALSHSEGREDLNEQLSGVESDRITVRRFGGDGGSLASLHVFICRAALGETEDETLSVLERFAERLLHYEREAREALRAHHDDDLAEAAARAYGTLLHARRLGVEEALELLSVVRMSVFDGQLDSIRAGDCTRLLFLVHDSQVAALDPDDSIQIDIRRANLVRSILANSARSQE